MDMEKKIKGYTEEQVLNSFRKKHDLKVVGKQIQELMKGKGDVGNGTKGKIDFMIKNLGYIHMYVKEFRY